MNPTAKIKKFTPLLDALVKEYGIITAAVWGRVWRYAQQNQKVCNASIETIATELNMGRQTVIRHIKVLVKNGYIKDHTPDKRNKPHTYSITKKAFIEIIVEAKEGVPEKDTKTTKVYQSGTVGVPEKHSDCTREVLEETTKKQYKKEIPDELNTETFLVAWEEWKQYRKEMRKPLKPTTIKRQLARLKKLPAETAAAMLVQSIENQWQGIFELKNGAGNIGELKRNQDGSINV